MGKEGDNVNTLAQGVSIAAKLIYMAIHIMLPSCKQVVQIQDLSAGGPPNQHQTILRPPFTFVQHLSEGIRKGDPNIIMCLLAISTVSYFGQQCCTRLPRRRFSWQADGRCCFQETRCCEDKLRVALCPD